MKVFIIGEDHVQDQDNIYRIYRQATTEKIFLGNEAILTPLGQGITNGLEDFVQFIYSSCMSIYIKYVEAPTEEERDSVELIKTDIQCKFDIVKDESHRSLFDEYYNSLYYEGVISDLMEVTYKFLAAADNKQSGMLAILEEFIAIILRYQKVDLAENKFLSIQYIATSSGLSKKQKEQMDADSQKSLRDIGLSESINQHILTANYLCYDSAVFIVGRAHLLGISEILGEKRIGIDIIYCQNYKAFDRAYRSHKIGLLEADNIDPVETHMRLNAANSEIIQLNDTKSVLTNFFKEKANVSETPEGNGELRVSLTLTEEEVAQLTEITDCNIQ